MRRKYVSAAVVEAFPPAMVTSLQAQQPPAQAGVQRLITAIPSTPTRP
jgi:hypothetical protein